MNLADLTVLCSFILCSYVHMFHMFFFEPERTNLNKRLDLEATLKLGSPIFALYK